MTKKARSRRKHIPVRTCIICRKAVAKRTLHRIVSVPEQGLLIDPSGKMPGRGAYLCSERACWEKATARESNALSRALRTVVSEEEKAALRDQWGETPEPDKQEEAAG
jgi:predicted RNA-binding protein YlxR (DUF448 family)